MLIITSEYVLDRLNLPLSSTPRMQFLIHTQTIPSLTNGTTADIAFHWNTGDTPEGNYTITANATILLGETDIADNTLTGWIVLAHEGDVNGDGVVDISDLYAIALAYGCEMGDLCYDPNVDVNCDGVIDISDLYACALQYGWPD